MPTFSVIISPEDRNAISGSSGESLGPIYKLGDRRLQTASHAR